eukprot:4227925-Alexandrium_andersonii.AAC.1
MPPWVCCWRVDGSTRATLSLESSQDVALLLHAGIALVALHGANRVGLVTPGTSVQHAEHALQGLEADLRVR